MNLKNIPTSFANETEEAEWWFNNREAHGQEILQSLKSGESQVEILTKEKLLARMAPSQNKRSPTPVLGLRIPEADIALARKQAERKGLPYQTYIKSLLHETLIEREKAN